MLSMLPIGLPISVSLAGPTSRKQLRMTPPIARWRRSCQSDDIIFSLFCLFFSFAATSKNIVMGSHNFHSFKKSAVFHKQCIREYEVVWFGQELWLPEKRLSDLSQLGVQFVARSGMEDSISSGIYNGRPHGGVSIAWSQSLDNANYRHKRVVCVELAAEPNPILLASLLKEV